MVRRGLADPKTAGRVCLWVEINNQDPLAVLYESCPDADRGRRLSDSALLIADDKNRQGVSPVTRETPAENGVNLGTKREVFVPSILSEAGLADHLSEMFCHLLES